MSEPLFTVELDKLVEVSACPYEDDRWIWTCLFDCPGSSGYSDFPEAEARSAAVEHLASVHGIQTAMSDPVKFLEKALAKAEGNVRANTGDALHTMYCGYDLVEYQSDCRCDGPATVLQLVSATRALLELHPLYNGACDICLAEVEPYVEAVHMEPYPCPTLLALAKGWGWTDV